jgi:hypothetical protein
MRRITLALTTVPTAKLADRRVQRLVYARHDPELMEGKPPVGRPPRTILAPTVSQRQELPREGWSEGSRSQTFGPTNRNAIEGRPPWGEPAQHGKAPRFGGHGKWRGCAGTVLGLIRGDLLRMQSPARGEDLRATPKGVECPLIPTAARTARRAETRDVTEQKSAEVILPGRTLPVMPGKDRTGKNKEESCPTRNRR